ncbi:protein FAM117B-like isoform X1 [Asterias rubens]|uniref:protein FAM117B-like isoform X1 n=1 Tax=Asterias rubens TaxID=7604 RepID=UPI00145599C6|nr:protein FAM117B-like isoform X1 [Asterias rubens]
MSSQPPQRSRRNASPRAGPQPMRATLPVTLQVRQSSPTRASNGRRSSPALASSPTQPWTTGENHKVKHRRSPDHRASPERSPSSPGFRVEKPKAVRASPIRRTNSLDTIAVPYLSGYWPRSETVNSSSTTSTTSHEPNQKDQSTQTEESDRKGSSHKRSSSWGSADNLKEKLRQQLRKQGNRQSTASTQRASPVHANHSTPTTYTTPSNSPSAAPTNQTLPRSTAIAVPNNSLKAPTPKIRGSVEGLNQEIERLVLHGVHQEEEGEKRGVIIQTQEPTCDGRRAPPPVLHTNDTGTQTPAENQDDGNISEETGSRGSGSRSHSTSPTFQMDGSPSRPSSRSSSTGNGEVKVEKEESSPSELQSCKYSSSPSHNNTYQLTRDPPDGCEKVRSIEEPSRIPLFIEGTQEYCPDKKVSFKLKPSDSSAFCPLLPNYPPGEFTKSPQAAVAATQTQTAGCGD